MKKLVFLILKIAPLPFLYFYLIIASILENKMNILEWDNDSIGFIIVAWFIITFLFTCIYYEKEKKTEISDVKNILVHKGNTTRKCVMPISKMPNGRYEALYICPNCHRFEVHKVGEDDYFCRSCLCKFHFIDLVS